MKSAVETLTPTRVKLTVEVASDELKPRMDAAYKTIAQQVNIPGFRRGKVPARIIDQRFGRSAVVQEALNDALPEYYTQAVRENDLQPLGQPEVNMTELPVEDGKDFIFEAEVDIVPALELPDFSTITVEVDPLEVKDEDVTSRMDALRARFGTLVGVERPAQEGDLTSIDLSAKVGDEEVDSVTGVSYEIGSGTMLPGLDDALTGRTAGETVEFVAPLAGGDHAGKDADVTVTLQSLKERQLPELDDDFAQLASEFDTMEELEADVRKQAEHGARFEQGLAARDKVLDAMLELTEIPVPANLVEAEVHKHLEDEDRLEDDVHRAEVTESTQKAMKTQFLLDAIVARDSVDVSQQELVEYLMTAAQQYGMNPQQFAQTLEQQGQVESMVSEVGRRKALASVLEIATVTDTDGHEVDLDLIDGDEDGDQGEGDQGAGGATDETVTEATEATEAAEETGEADADADESEEAAKA